jgi:hypothetical protein
MKGESQGGGRNPGVSETKRGTFENASNLEKLYKPSEARNHEKATMKLEIYERQEPRTTKTGWSRNWIDKSLRIKSHRYYGATISREEYMAVHEEYVMNRKSDNGKK